MLPKNIDQKITSFDVDRRNYKLFPSQSSYANTTAAASAFQSKKIDSNIDETDENCLSYTEARHPSKGRKK